MHGMPLPRLPFDIGLMMSDAFQGLRAAGRVVALMVADCRIVQLVLHIRAAEPVIILIMALQLTYCAETLLWHGLCYLV